jgi:hypothetical protein
LLLLSHFGASPLARHHLRQALRLVSRARCNGISNLVMRPKLPSMTFRSKFAEVRELWSLWLRRRGVPTQRRSRRALAPRCPSSNCSSASQAKPHAGMCGSMATAAAAKKVRAPAFRGARRGEEDVVVFDPDFEASSPWRRRSWRRGWGTAPQAPPWRAQRTRPPGQQRGKVSSLGSPSDVAGFDPKSPNRLANVVRSGRDQADHAIKISN